ncbi:MAG: hypothetical protein ACRD8U_08425 [Pyrinomonadaceae bacterium]
MVALRQAKATPITSAMLVKNLNCIVYFPASNVRGIPIEENKGRECPEPQQGPLETMQSVGLIGVGERRSSGTGVILTREQIANVEEGATQLYVYLVSKYNGLFGEPYSLKYYGKYSAVTGHFQDCPTHNEAT